MTGLERIVRPFQSKDVTPPQRILNPSEPAVDNVVLRCGQSGSTKTFNSSFSSTITSYVANKQRELSRDTHVKRVTNPDDETQYVDVELIDKLKTSGVNGQQTTFTFKNKRDGD
ncbi:MAG: hypothetical protein KGK33_08840 [Hyphomicrobiales bacterium]|nr:hypothetical protein [Hyphomicrobiales bacterium]